MEGMSGGVVSSVKLGIVVGRNHKGRDWRRDKASLVTENLSQRLSLGKVWSGRSVGV